MVRLEEAAARTARLRVHLRAAAAAVGAVQRAAAQAGVQGPRAVRAWLAALEVGRAVVAVQPDAAEVSAVAVAASEDAAAVALRVAARQAAPDRKVSVWVVGTR